MKKIKLNKKGLTLIEIILSITIFSILIVMITTMYLNFLKIHSELEEDSLQNTDIINTINSIKYRIDNAKDLQILDKYELSKLKNLGKDYKYICLYNENIITGRIGEENSSEILNSNKFKNINLIFENINNGLNIKLNFNSENISSISSFVNLYTMQNNNISIKGEYGNAIIYKSNEK